MATQLKKTVILDLSDVILEGILRIPQQAKSIVLFAHGAGSGRLSPRNNFVASILHQAQIATLLFDLLTEEEDRLYENRFNIQLLVNRLIAVTKWVKIQSQIKNLPIGFFGASTGAAAALIAAANLSAKLVKAVVSRGGRPDLAQDVLDRVEAPTLLIVGGNDPTVLKMNQDAYKQINAVKKLITIPGATHLFEEPGTLEKVASLARDWFKKYL